MLSGEVAKGSYPIQSGMFLTLCHDTEVNFVASSHDG